MRDDADYPRADATSAPLLTRSAARR